MFGNIRVSVKNERREVEYSGKIRLYVFSILSDRVSTVVPLPFGAPLVTKLT